MDGEYVANRLADALYNLGFPWDKIGEEGLQIVDRFASPDAEVESDQELLDQMREYFEDVRQSPPDIPPLTPETTFGPSEYTVVDSLVISMEDLAGRMPWVAEPIYDILDDYDEYLEAVKAPKKSRTRSRRIRHAVSDIEDRASGRA